MFEKFKERALNKAIDRISKELAQCDFNILRHECMKLKWQALREKDDLTYDMIDDYIEIINVLERIFSKKEGTECQ